ncbi:hypothetical protein BJ165DRAFT_1567874 [Panaeolus papilionaceus]|nr:hypothetical protein BJ165DRAFT_1567874 [Panaeolus papilionaceus]
MALDFCSAPATSVDAECAFSTGRRQVNFMQTGMSSQTFKAKMAVGSWTQSPLYPGFHTVKGVIEQQMHLDKDMNIFLDQGSA